jgi:hypothetical protein
LNASFFVCSVIPLQCEFTPPNKITCAASGYMSSFAREIVATSTQTGRLLSTHITSLTYCARTVEPQKQPLLSNGCVTLNNGITLGSGVFCAVRAEAIHDEDQSLETACPYGGGFDYLHHRPASRRRRRKGTQCLRV